MLFWILRSERVQEGQKTAGTDGNGWHSGWQSEALPRVNAVHCECARLRSENRTEIARRWGRDAATGRRVALSGR